MRTVGIIVLVLLIAGWVSSAYTPGGKARTSESVPVVEKTTAESLKPVNKSENRAPARCQFGVCPTPVGEWWNVYP